MLPGISPVSPYVSVTQRLSQTAQDVDDNSSSLASLRSQQQVGRALEQDFASRSVSPAANTSLPLVAAATALPVSAQSRLDGVSQALGSYLAGPYRRPHPEWAALYSFLKEEASSAQRLGQHDLFAALAEQQDSEGHSFLYLAVRRGETWVVDWLLNAKPASFSVTDPFTGQNDEKTNPLHLAVAQRYPALVAGLVAREADINIVNSLGQTPLHVAVEDRNDMMIARLLKSGADTRIVNDSGYIALQVAINSGRRIIVRPLLEQNRDISFRDRFGRTPLHWAVENRDANMVSFLLKNNADVNAIDGMKRTPLCVAARQNDRATAQLLLARNADIDFRDESGRTALDWARTHENGQLMQKLIFDHIQAIEGLE